MEERTNDLVHEVGEESGKKVRVKIHKRNGSVWVAGRAEEGQALSRRAGLGWLVRVPDTG